MLNDLKFSFVNIDQESLSAEIGAKVKYYANAIHWTLIYSLPLFWLLDYSFLATDWLVLFMTRIVLVILCHSIYLYGGLSRNNWDMEIVMSFIIGLNTVFYAVVCSVVSVSFVLPYFLMFSVFFLLLNISIFWKPVFSIIQCAVAYLLIIVLFKIFNKFDGYDILISNGGGIFFVISAFSCLIGFNKYQLTKREIGKNIMIEMAHNRQIDQHEKISDQQHQINEANRKLTRLSEYRYNTLNMILHDFRNFTGSIQMSLDLLHQTDANLTEEQKEILGYINTGNDKLKYLSEKLASSAETDAERIDYNYKKIDLGKKVEQATMDLSDAATMKQINLQLNIDPSPTFVNLDEIFLDQVLVKLLSNVIRYASSGTIVSIHLHKTETIAITDIANKGKLLGHQKLEQLFNDLESNADSSTNPALQNTSGFAVAKKMAEQMGGKLTYNSDDSTGNFYRLEFNLSK